MIYFMMLYLCFNDCSMILERFDYDFFMISYVKQKQTEKKHKQNKYVQKMGLL